MSASFGEIEDVDALIDRAFRGEAGAEELDRLAAWRAASFENERRYGRTIRLLEAARLLGSATPDSRPPGVSGLLEAAAPTVPADRAIRPTGPAGVAPPPRRGWIPWGIAAAAVLVLVVSRILVPPAPAPATAVIRTGPTELATVELEDGSVVRLGPSSSLDLRPPGGGRGVALEGRAFFNVAERPDSRFRVRTALGEAVVLGTRFEVDADDERLELLVVEGRVALSAGGRDVEVGRGERSGIVDGALLEPRLVADADSLLRWAGTFIVFRSTPLRDAAAEVERVYGVRVSIEDSAIAARTVTGTFVDRTAREVLDVLCSIGDVSCRFEPDRTVISP